MDAHKQAYKEEAYELLAELETSLLELEESPEDPDLIGRVFRTMHTIKGSGAMFGFDDIAAFTHEVETVFDLVRNGRVVVTRELVNLTLLARDHIKVLLDGGEAADGAHAARIIAGLKEMAPAAEATAAFEQTSLPDPPSAAEGNVTYRIRFVPGQEILTQGTNPMLLLSELHQLGDCKAVARMAKVPDLAAIDPESCCVSWDIILTTRRGIDAIKDVFIFIEDDCELEIDVIGGDGVPETGAGGREPGDILPGSPGSALKDSEPASGRLKPVLEHEPAVSGDASSSLEQQHAKDLHKERQAQEPASSIRVPSDKLDMLVNLVGELVTVQARLTKTATDRSDPLLMGISEEVERLTNELRDTALNIRMLPIGTTFRKFKRLVRDLSIELGKEIEMETSGAETELDKTVLEKLSDPLVHLIRNSIDHGIEHPDQRFASGKPRQGTIHLAAVHSGDSVLITISDDGAGLDRESIRSKGVERGLITANAELSDKEIYSLIFAPGFSTAKSVTSVSGRGVGMDVVKKAIDALRGSIELASERGKGTVITVKLPLTLAIIESLLVKIGGDSFVIPLSIVEECVELSREDVKNAHGRNVAAVRGKLVPYVQLRERFMIESEKPEIEQIVITNVNWGRVGFVVDQVVGEHQTVIKSLGKMYKDVKGLSGATILGDGSVALILDIPTLVRDVERGQEQEFTQCQLVSNQ